MCRRGRGPGREQPRLPPPPPRPEQLLPPPLAWRGRVGGPRRTTGRRESRAPLEFSPHPAPGGAPRRFLRSEGSPRPQRKSTGAARAGAEAGARSGGLQAPCLLPAAPPSRPAPESVPTAGPGGPSASAFDPPRRGAGAVEPAPPAEGPVHWFPWARLSLLGPRALAAYPGEPGRGNFSRRAPRRLGRPSAEQRARRRGLGSARSPRPAVASPRGGGRRGGAASARPATRAGLGLGSGSGAGGGSGRAAAARLVYSGPVSSCGGPGSSSSAAAAPLPRAAPPPRSRPRPSRSRRPCCRGLSGGPTASWGVRRLRFPVAAGRKRGRRAPLPAPRPSALRAANSPGGRRRDETRTRNPGPE